MTNETTLPELPEPAAWENRSALSSEVRYTRIPVQSLQPGVFTHVKLFTADQMRAYAQQATADLSDQLFLKEASFKRLSVEMTQLRAELEQCMADAERYRWLRAQSNDDWTFSVVKNPHFDVYESAEELDAAIDAARGAK